MKPIIGESTALTQALDHASLLAPLNRPVLIIGERGSGKEAIAERLHFLSARWSEQFQKVNCAALSDELLDSELFGHEAGAFTGATRAHKGRFERADGGTLFLDELATMAQRTQEKLLRVIEYGEFERVGGRQTVTIDVRIVAATNADLPQLAKRGKFRADLLDRLAFDVVNVPPLRERGDDIHLLAEHFATKMCGEIDRPYFAGFSDPVKNELAAYSWPGNIRELKNTIERSVCRSAGDEEHIKHIIFDPFKTPASTSKTETNSEQKQQALNQPVQATAQAFNFTEATAEYEISLLRNALQQCQQHQRKTADYMGLSYHQLRALLKKYKHKL